MAGVGMTISRKARLCRLRCVFMRVLPVTALAGLLLLHLGCSDDTVSSLSEMSSYSGELRWDKTPGFVGSNGIDTIRISIDGDNFTYTMLINKGGFCNSTGQVIGFGSDSAEFIVGSIIGLPCDSVRILRGKFGTIFRGDSLFLSGQLRDGIRQMDYDYRLVIENP